MRCDGDSEPGGAILSLQAFKRLTAMITKLSAFKIALKEIALAALRTSS